MRTPSRQTGFLILFGSVAALWLFYLLIGYEIMEVLRGGKVRRAKLFYLRKSLGKKGRIEEERAGKEGGEPTSA